MFYTYRQNPLRGKFRGPRAVVVEANNAEHANERFPYSFLESCDCCGYRWTPVRQSDGMDVSTVIPMLYGKPVNPSADVRIMRLSDADYFGSYLEQEG